MVFATEFLETIKNILFGVSQKPSLLWEIIPLLGLWFLLEIYFGKYVKEELGWNTALGNGISLFWIVVGSIQFIFAEKILFKENWGLFLGIFIIGFYSLLVIFVSFTHSLKDKWTYILASPTTIFYFSIIALLLAHNIIVLSLSSISAIFILFALFILFFFILRLIIPTSKKSDDDLDESSDMDFKESESKESNKDNFDSDLPAGDLENEINSNFSSQSDSFSDQSFNNSPPSQNNINSNNMNEHTNMTNNNMWK